MQHQPVPVPVPAFMLRPGDTFSFRPDGAAPNTVVATVWRREHRLCGIELADRCWNLPEGDQLYMISARRIMTIRCGECRTERSILVELVGGTPDYACAGCH